MEWSKAKNMLIILFLMLNIILAAYLVLSFHNDSSTKNIENTVKILKNRGYILKTKIPTTVQSNKLIYENKGLDQGFITGKLLNNASPNLKGIKLNQIQKDGSKTLKFTSINSFTYDDGAPIINVDISTRKKVENYGIAVIKRLKLPISNPYVDYYKLNLDKSVNVIFIEKLEGKYIFDNTVSFKITNKGLKVLKCNLVKVKDFDKKVNIVPAYQILLKYFITGNKTSINRIDLGYEFGSNVGVNGDKTPEWRILLGDGNKIFFDNQGLKK